MSLVGYAGLAFVLVGVVLLLDRRSRTAGVALAVIGAASATMAIGSARPPNPDAIAAFRAIEARCAAEPPVVRTPRCAGALDLQRRCAAEPCTAKEYHRDLTNLGFHLPPL